MKVIIKMTTEEFIDLQNKRHFSTRRKLAEYLESFENGGEPIDEIIVQGDGIRTTVYAKERDSAEESKDK